MNLNYWLNLPTDTELLLQIIIGDARKTITCKYSHTCYDEIENNAYIYCKLYNEEFDEYCNYSELLLDFYNNEFVYQEIECTDIYIFNEKRTIGYPKIYVPIDKKYFEKIKENYKLFDICYDYMDQGWSQIDEDNIYDIYVDDHENRVKLLDREELWIKNTI